jgi:hypothetical protein
MPGTICVAGPSEECHLLFVGSSMTPDSQAGDSRALRTGPERCPRTQPCSVCSAQHAPAGLQGAEGLFLCLLESLSSHRLASEHPYTPVNRRQNSVPSRRCVRTARVSRGHPAVQGPEGGGPCPWTSPIHRAPYQPWPPTKHLECGL